MKKAGQTAARKLWAAHEAMGKFRQACADAGIGADRADDTRITLPEKMAEYAKYLDMVHGGGQ